MKYKNMMRALSALMCIVMVLALLGGCAAPAETPDDGHDHEHEDVNTTDPGDVQTPADPDPAEEPGDVETLGDEDVPTSGTYCAGDHNFKIVRSVSDGQDCVMGSVNYQVYQCTKCGLEYYTAIRDNDKNDNPVGGAHQWREEQLPGGCPGNPGKMKICDKCGMRVYTGGGSHKWSDWTAPEASVPCTGTYTETRSCTNSGCTETETRTHNPVGHSWRTVSDTPATCTEARTIVKTCNRCGETTTETVGAALGHNYGGDNTDCTAERKCTRCGQTVPGGSHTFTLYVKDGANGHYLLCAVCRIKDTTLYKHYDRGDGYCVCGYQLVTGAKPGQCNHDWQYLERNPDKPGSTGRNGAFSHWEKCSKCGETRSASCSNYPDTETHLFCTDDTYCTVCGNKIADGNSKHYMGDWIITAEGHERHCESVLGCNYVEKAAHTFNGKSNDCTKPDKCTVCGYTTASAASKQHNWGAWYDGGNGTHIRKCQNPGCTVTESAMHTVTGSTDDCTHDMVCSVCSAIVVEGSDTHVWGHPVSAGEGGHNRHCLHPGCSAVQNEAHKGGTATCASPAQCSECGGFYGAKDPNNHTGGTEIRDARPAEVGKPGYTGDVYCKGCGQMIEAGKEIEALKEDHVHAYSSDWSTDAESHWHDCECGERNSVAAHTFKDGKCTVCGVADPNYVVHVHSYTESWSADAHNHWHVCTGCGDKTDVSEHVIVTTDDGTTHCLTCGMTLETYEEQITLEEHPSVKFTDLNTAPKYQSEAVDFVYSKGLMSGMSDTSFNPNGNTTRGQIMTILAKMDGVDTSGDWQKKGLDWAVSKGLTENDDVNAVMSRPELIYMLWKATGSQAADLSVLDAYSDAGTLEGENRQAMAWAVEALGLKGDGKSLLLDQPISRIQFAIILNSANSKGILG